MFSHRLPLPAPRPSVASPTGEASGNSVSSEHEVNPWGLLLAGWPLPGVGVPRPSQTPGAEAVLAQLLFLQQAQAVQFDRAGDEANLTALLHQSPDPPVIIVFLQTTTAGGVGETKKEIRGTSQQPAPGDTTPNLAFSAQGMAPSKSPGTSL